MLKTIQIHECGKYGAHDMIYQVALLSDCEDWAVFYTEESQLGPIDIRTFVLFCPYCGVDLKSDSKADLKKIIETVIKKV